ncbi:hypothetical protein Tco_0295949 [Tanacetum coccineum]
MLSVELQGDQENRDADVIQDSNDHVAVAQRKLEVKQLEGKTNTACLVNKQVQHGANIGAVIMKIEVPSQEGAEGNAAERDAVACEVISKNIFVMKEDMDTRSNYLGFTCKSKAEIWVTKGLLDEAKEIILGMEIFRTQSEDGLSGNRDEEKKSKGS